MKKLLLIAAIAGFTFACNDGSKSSTTSTDTATATPALSILRLLQLSRH